MTNKISVKQNKIVHIVPSVPPAIDGLSEYCHALWKHWPQPVPEWWCLAANVPDQAQTVWPQVEIMRFELNGPSLIETLETSGARAVVLHYVGYAYQPKGVPFWLPKALRVWKHRHKEEAHLTVMFHELYAKGSWRQTSFWLLPIAKRIMMDLAELADQWVTSCPDYVEKLAVETNTSAKGTLIPVGSNIKSIEPITRQFWDGHPKKLKLVFFGMPGTRLWSLQAHENLIARMCQQQMVKQITLLGKHDPSSRFFIEMKELQRKIGFETLWNEVYDLSTERISEVLSNHDIGFVANSPGIISKSLVYAALCAHSVIPVASTKTGEREWPNYPCVVNDDTRPEVSIRFLEDFKAVQEMQSRVQVASRTILNWESIAVQWTRVLRLAENTAFAPVEPAN
jgi:hypothetical protein